MRFTSKWIVSGIVFCLLIFTALFFFHRSESYPLKFNWESGARQMYRVKMIYEMDIELSKEDRGHFSQQIDGILNFRILEANPDKIKIGFQLSPIAIYISGKRVPELESIYSTFFLASFRRTGKPIKFYFPNNISEQEEIAISEVIRGLQVIIPENMKDKKDWSTEEAHSTGKYIARYAVDGNTILKKKLKYLSVDVKTVRGEAPASKVKIINSRFMAKPSIPLSWLETVSGSEDLNIKSGNVVWLKAEMRTSLELVPFKPDPSLIIWKEKRSFEEILASFKKGKKEVASYWEKKQGEALKKELEHVDLNEIVSQLAKTEGKDINEIHLLRDYLCSFPEEASEIPALLLKKDINSGAAASIINALELSGHPEAQKALVSVMQDNHQLPLNRIRAIVALNGIQEPTGEALNALWDQFETRSNSLSLEMSNTAALALGSISNTLKDEDPDLSMEINFHLAECLSNTGNNKEETIILLKAMGNAADSSLVREIEPFISSEEPAIRAAAAEAYRNYADADSLSILSRQLTIEPEQEVRNAIVESLINREPDIGCIAIVQSLISAETNEDVRYNMIMFLGKNKEDYPQVITTLKEQASQEKSPEVLKLIYTHLIPHNDKPMP